MTETTHLHTNLNGSFAWNVCRCTSTEHGTCEFTNWAETARVTLDHDAQTVTISRLDSDDASKITLDGSMIALALDIAENL